MGAHAQKAGINIRAVGVAFVIDVSDKSGAPNRVAIAGAVGINARMMQTTAPITKNIKIRFQLVIAENKPFTIQSMMPVEVRPEIRIPTEPMVKARFQLVFVLISCQLTTLMPGINSKAMPAMATTVTFSTGIQVPRSQQVSRKQIIRIVFFSLDFRLPHSFSWLSSTCKASSLMGSGLNAIVAHMPQIIIVIRPRGANSITHCEKERFTPTEDNKSIIKRFPGVPAGVITPPTPEMAGRPIIRIFPRFDFNGSQPFAFSRESAILRYMMQVDRLDMMDEVTAQARNRASTSFLGLPFDQRISRLQIRNGKEVFSSAIEIANVATQKKNALPPKLE